MRPYLAIIKDSFREAVASRVLWVMLGLITLVLLSLAPFTYREKRTIGLPEGELDGWIGLLEKLRAAGSDEQPSPARRVWTLLEADEQEQIRSFKPPGERPTLREGLEAAESRKQLETALDRVIRRDDFYDEASWSGAPVGSELKALKKTPYDQLAEQDRLRFNRLLLEAAFPESIASSPPTSLQFRYAIWDVLTPLPIRKPQLVENLIANLPWLIDKGLLSIGLLIAILVTAPMIPQTFDPGSLHLLLSKPVLRPLLYLAKFAGGCAFVFLCVTYLFLGCWLIFGLQWGVWEEQILWCIPVYVFVFATYYSVSALAGAIWRNTVVAVIAALVFWTLCFSVGSSYAWMSGMIGRYRIARIAPGARQLVAAEELNTLLVWQPEQKNWKPLFVSGEHEQIRGTLILLPVGRFPSMVGPVFDARNDQIVAATPSLKSFGRMVMVSARAGEKWKVAEGAAAPGEPFALVVEPDGHPLLVTTSGISRINRDISSNAVMLRMPGFSIPLTRAESLASAGPEPAQFWGEPVTAAFDGKSSRLLVYTRGELSTLAKDAAGAYQVAQEEQVSTDDRNPVVLAAGGGFGYVLTKTGKVTAWDAARLTPAGEWQLASDSPPRSAVATADGQSLFVLCHDGRLHQLDRASGKIVRPRVKGQGDISAIAVDGDDRLYVASRATRVIVYQLEPARLGAVRQVEAFDPPLSFQEQTFYRGVAPAYYLLPKPGEFYKTVQFLLSGQETVAEDNKTLATAQENLNPWSPIWSGLAFQVVMLALGCLYIQRQEF